MPEAIAGRAETEEAILYYSLIEPDMALENAISENEPCPRGEK